MSCCCRVSRVLSELMVELQQQIVCLYELANCIAVLDMLAAFAHNCTLDSYSQLLNSSLISVDVVCTSLNYITTQGGGLA